jgi:hypothetical protein
MSASFDLFDAFGTPEYVRDPHAYLQRLRAQEPIHRSRRSGFLYVTRHADCVKLLRSPKFGRDLRAWDSPYNTYRPENAPRDPSAAAINQRLQPWMLNSDPPDHTRLRRVFAHAFVPAAVNEMELAIAAETRALLASLPARAELELVERFALPLSGRIVSRLFDVPVEHSEQLAAWSQDIMLSQTPIANLGTKHAAKRALEAFESYMTDFIAKRRAMPGVGLVDRVIEAERREGRLSERELIVNVLGILLAGHETTSALIGNGVLTLLQHPKQLDDLRRDPSMNGAAMGRAIEEILRFEPPSTLTPRVVLECDRLGEQTLQVGQLCWVVHAAVNRDPQVFADPDSFDITRSPNPHQTFGGGLHHCIGAALARLTARAALGQLLSRYRRLALIDREPAWRASVSTRALRRLTLAVGE